MGGIRKEANIKGRTLAEAFEKLQDSDKEELGNDYYNGGWNNASGIKEVSRDEFENGNPYKHEDVWALCTRKPVENNMKVKTTVTNFPAKGTRKWVTKYVVDDPRWGGCIVSELKQSDAIKKARNLVEKNPSWRLDVYITKELEAQDSKVAKINYKKSSKEKDGNWYIKALLPY